MKKLLEKRNRKHLEEKPLQSIWSGARHGTKKTDWKTGKREVKENLGRTIGKRARPEGIPVRLKAID